MMDLSTFNVEMSALPPAGRTLVGILPPEALTEVIATRVIPLEAVTAELSLRMENRRLHVVGWVRSKVRLTCSRCLEPYATTLELDIDRFYVDYEPPMKEGGEYEMQDDTVCLKDGLFSALRMTEEELILALPMLPLCNFACAGLCPGCGVDLNHEVCSCTGNETDNPFAALRVLKKKS